MDPAEVPGNREHFNAIVHAVNDTLWCLAHRASSLENTAGTTQRWRSSTECAAVLPVHPRPVCLQVVPEFLGSCEAGAHSAGFRLVWSDGAVTRSPT